MSLIANQPSSIAKILDASFKLYVVSFKKVIGFGLIISVFSLLASIGTNIFIPADTANSEQLEIMAMQAMIPVILLMMVASVLALIFYTSIIYRIDNIACGREDSFGEAFMVGIKKFPSLFWGFILYLIGITAASLLLLIPGIALSLSMAFYLYFIVVENNTAYAALKASHKLVWGDWWRTLMVFMVPSILMLIVYLLLGMFAVYFTDLDATNTGPVNIADIIVNLISALLVPYFYALGYVQYRDLKLRKTGDDLEARMMQDIA